MTYGYSNVCQSDFINCANILAVSVSPLTFPASPPLPTLFVGPQHIVYGYLFAGVAVVVAVAVAAAVVSAF